MNKQDLILKAPCCLTQNSMLITVGMQLKNVGKLWNGMNTDEYLHLNPDISALILPQLLGNLNLDC